MKNKPHPIDNFKNRESQEFEPLIAYLNKVPAVSTISCGFSPNNTCWIKIIIDIKHKLAWNVVQEFGYVLNGISLTEPLPTIFKPVSPPPYMNGGPKDYLSWIIETTDPQFTPKKIKEWLWGRLPRPVENLENWEIN